MNDRIFRPKRGASVAMQTRRLDGHLGHRVRPGVGSA